MISKEDLATWVEEQFATVRDTGGLSIIALEHFRADGTSVDVHTMHSKMADKWTAENVARVMDATASRFAKGLPGVQQFQISAVFGAATKPAALLPFQRVGALTHGPVPGGGLATEAATPQGGLAQGMRLTELLVQGSFAQNAHNATTMQTLLERVLARLEATEKNNAELWLGLKNVLLELQTHATSMAMKGLQYDLGKKLVGLLPGMANAMTGKEIFPRAQVERSLIETIGDTLSGEEQATLISAIGARENGGMLAGVLADQLTKHRQRRAAEAAETNRLLREAPPRTYDEAEADAMGQAIRALRGDASKHPELPAGAAKKIANAVDSAAAAATTAAANDAHPDSALVAAIFEGVGESEVAMMAQVLGNRTPGLGEKILARFAQLKEAGNVR